MAIFSTILLRSPTQIVELPQCVRYHFAWPFIAESRPRLSAECRRPRGSIREDNVKRMGPKTIALSAASVVAGLAFGGVAAAESMSDLVVAGKKQGRRTIIAVAHD